jgi:hypothetical protein
MNTLSWVRLSILKILVLVFIGIGSPLYAQSCDPACPTDDQCCGGQCVPTSFTCCGNVPSQNTVCCPDNKTTCPSGQACFKTSSGSYGCCAAGQVACGTTCCSTVCCNGYCCPASKPQCLADSCYPADCKQEGNEIVCPASLTQRLIPTKKPH